MWTEYWWNKSPRAEIFHKTGVILPALEDIFMKGLIYLDLLMNLLFLIIVSVTLKLSILHKGGAPKNKYTTSWNLFFYEHNLLI